MSLRIQDFVQCRHLFICYTSTSLLPYHSFIILFVCFILESGLIFFPTLSPRNYVYVLLNCYAVIVNIITTFRLFFYLMKCYIYVPRKSHKEAFEMDGKCVNSNRDSHPECCLWLWDLNTTTI